MLLGIDHLVIAVADPDAAAADLEARLGLAATAGGRHASGTWNRLVFLGDTYLELIGAWDRALAAAHPIGAAALAQLDAGTEGLAAFALASDSLAVDVGALQAVGSPISGPVPGERIRPDGGRVAWQIAALPRLGFELPPFLIEHELAGPEWGADARAARTRFRHPFGGEARLVGLEIAVAEPARAAAAWTAALGLRFAAAPDGEPGARETVVGEQKIRLVGLTDVDAAAPRAHVGIRTSGGPKVLADASGIRFARL